MFEKRRNKFTKKKDYKDRQKKRKSKKKKKNEKIRTSIKNREKYIYQYFQKLFLIEDRLINLLKKRPKHWKHAKMWFVIMSSAQ